MSRLLISPRHLSAVGLHAQALYPQECCGVLIGRFLDPEGRRVQVERILAARNECACEADDPSAAKSRYAISPQTVLSAHRQASQQGLEVVGYYHSHPDQVAEPSDLDLDQAWARLSYLIVAVHQGQPESVRSWRLAEDRGCFEEQTLDVGGMPMAAMGLRARG